MKLYGNTSLLYLIYCWICYKILKPTANYSISRYFRPYKDGYVTMQSGKDMKVQFLYSKNDQHYYSYIGYVNEKQFKDFGLIEFIKFCRNN